MRLLRRRRRQTTVAELFIPEQRRPAPANPPHTAWHPRPDEIHAALEACGCRPAAFCSRHQAVYDRLWDDPYCNSCWPLYADCRCQPATT